MAGKAVTRKLFVKAPANVSSMVDGSGTANYVPLWLDSNTLGNSVIYQDVSSVGINTTLPGAKLGIKSSAVSSEFNIKSVSSSSVNLFSVKNDSKTVIGDDYAMNANLSCRDNGSFTYTAFFYGKSNASAIYGFGEGATNGVSGETQSGYAIYGVVGSGQSGTAVYGTSGNSGGLSTALYGSGQGADYGLKAISQGGVAGYFHSNTGSAIVCDSGNIIVTGGYISVAGVGSNSERFGFSTTSAGANSGVFGKSSSSAGDNSLIFGYNSSTSILATETLLFGNNINTTSSNGITIGHGGVNWNDSTGIGHGVNPGGSRSFAGGSGAEGGTETVTVGYQAGGSGLRNMSFGYQASATGAGGAQYSIAFGPLTNTGFDQVICIGGGAAGTGPNQCLIGGPNTSITNFHLGKGVTSAAPVAVTIQSTGGSTSGVNGADIIIASGQGGVAADKGGDVLFKTAQTGSGTTLTTRIQISEDKIGFFGATPVVQQTMGAATAGVLYTSTEQAMLQAVYDAVRNIGIGT